MKTEGFRYYIDEQPQHIDLTQALEQLGRLREHVLRYQRKHDQRLSAAVWMLLLRALRDDYGITQAPRVLFTDLGKPLLNHHSLHISLSHCDKAVACAVGPAPVGIDIECCATYEPDLLPLTMNRQEQQSIRSATNPAQEFTRLWTMKESLLKLRGDGLTECQLPHALDTAPHYHFHTSTTEHYVCTFCHP